ncbi:MAG: shikimate dehydrogenase [Gemmatimonadaceae bacterium]
MTRLPSRLVLLGHPVAHSLSSAMQNAALRSAGVPLTYAALDVAPRDLETTLRALHEGRAAGNVTLPHKAQVARLCDALTGAAARAEAANTFWVADDGTLHGDNTDVAGFDALVVSVLGEIPRRARIALLGAGGGAGAVLAAIERWERCEVTLYNRTRARAEALAARFEVVTTVAGSAAEAGRGADVVVNATSVGLRDAELPVSPGDLQGAVVDLVYRPGGTRWVRAARERGLRAGDGLEMLLEQGALAFERWLAAPAPRAVMRAALQTAVASSPSGE